MRAAATSAEMSSEMSSPPRSPARPSSPSRNDDSAATKIDLHEPGGNGVLTSLLVPLHSTLQAALDAATAVVDEEDAVLLYRCNRLAESCPDLLEACDLRRSAIHTTLKADFETLWQKAHMELSARVDELSEAALAAKRALVHDAATAQEKVMNQARLAAEMRAQQLLLEKDAEREAALKSQAEVVTRRVEAERDKMMDELHSQSVMARAQGQAMKQQAERQVEDMQKQVRVQRCGGCTRTGPHTAPAVVAASICHLSPTTRRCLATCCCRRQSAATARPPPPSTPPPSTVPPSTAGGQSGGEAWDGKLRARALPWRDRDARPARQRGARRGARGARAGGLAVDGFQ